MACRGSPKLFTALNKNESKWEWHMGELKAVLFDVYGTLIDIHTDEHRDDIFEALSRFLEYRRVYIAGKEIKELYLAQINQQFAKSRERYPEVDVTQAFARVLREHGGTTDRYLNMIITQLYRSLSREHFRLYNDTFWVLNEFRKRYRLGIISDAQRLFCNPELRTLRIENFFDAAVISSDYGFRKPDPRLFHIALAALNVKPSEAAFIGNKYETDLIGAKEADLEVVGLINQSDEEKRSYNQIHKPDFVTDNLNGALKEILAKERGGKDHEQSSAKQITKE
jgi:putative hydrolase of the HAD superfamily